MARPPVTMSKPQSADDGAPAMFGETESVTYLPREGDPPKVTWGGKTFHANVAVPVNDRAMIAKARSNPCFHVGENAPHVKVEETGDPKTPEQYRAHVAAWLPKVSSTAQLDARWAAEEELRIACGVGGEDFDLLGALMGPRRAELKKADVA